MPVPGRNLPAMWRLTNFFSDGYPITAVASSQSTKNLVVEITKYINTEMLSRLFVRVNGPIVVAGAGPGTPTGLDNIEALMVTANLTTQPQYQNVVPINNVSSRGLLYDAMFQRGWLDKAAAVPDVAGIYNIDTWYEVDFYQAKVPAGYGIDYSMPLAKYRSVLLTLQFGGRDQLFSGGTNTWDLSGLNISLYADLDVGTNPEFIHAHELFENNYAISATTSDFKIDTLPPGFDYTDFYFLTEEAGALADGIINNINIQSGSQQWLLKGENNAPAIRQSMSKSNRNRAISDPNQDFTGIYAIPLRDGMFTRGFDARFAQLTMSLDVVAGAATNIRLVGRRMIPGGIYQRTGK